MIKLDNHRYNLFSSSFYKVGLNKEYLKKYLPTDDNPDDNNQVPLKLDESSQVNLSAEHLKETGDFEEVDSSIKKGR